MTTEVQNSKFKFRYKLWSYSIYILIHTYVYIYIYVCVHTIANTAMLRQCNAIQCKITQSPRKPDHAKSKRDKAYALLHSTHFNSFLLTPFCLFDTDQVWGGSDRAIELSRNSNLGPSHVKPSHAMLCRFISLCLSMMMQVYARGLMDG